MGVDTAWCQVAIRSYMEENPEATFPLDIGQDYTQQQKTHMTLFLVLYSLFFFEGQLCYLLFCKSALPFG